MSGVFDGTNHLRANEPLRGNGPRLVPPYTMVAWGKTTSDSAAQYALMIQSPTEEFNYVRLAWLGTLEDPDTGHVIFGVSHDAHHYAESPDLYSTDTWEIGFGVASDTATTAAYLGAGAAGTGDGVTQVPEYQERTTIGARENGSGLGAYWQGKLGLIAVYAKVLSDAERSELASGAHPLNVARDSLRFLMEGDTFEALGSDSDTEGIDYAVPAIGPIFRNYGSVTYDGADDPPVTFVSDVDDRTVRFVCWETPLGLAADYPESFVQMMRPKTSTLLASDDYDGYIASGPGDPASGVWLLEVWGYDVGGGDIRTAAGRAWWFSKLQGTLEALVDAAGTNPVEAVIFDTELTPLANIERWLDGKDSSGVEDDLGTYGPTSIARGIHSFFQYGDTDYTAHTGLEKQVVVSAWGNTAIDHQSEWMDRSPANYRPGWVQNSDGRVRMAALLDDYTQVGDTVWPWLMSLGETTSLPAPDHPVTRGQWRGNVLTMLDHTEATHQTVLLWDAGIDAAYWTEMAEVAFELGILAETGGTESTALTDATSGTSGTAGTDETAGTDSTDSTEVPAEEAGIEGAGLNRDVTAGNMSDKLLTEQGIVEFDNPANGAYRYAIGSARQRFRISSIRLHCDGGSALVSVLVNGAQRALLEAESGSIVDSQGRGLATDGTDSWPPFLLDSSPSTAGGTPDDLVDVGDSLAFRVDATTLASTGGDIRVVIDYARMKVRGQWW